MRIQPGMQNKTPRPGDGAALAFGLAALRRFFWRKRRHHHRRPIRHRNWTGWFPRVALYPDPLLSQILAAATFPDQIPDAARWADQHHYLTGDALARAISDDRLPWDPSVQSLLPFPSVLG